jgi:acetoacetyl-CoA reductase
MARVAVVTGGTRGIGAAISKALKGAGYNVAASYAGNDAAAQTFKTETSINVYKWDVSSYDRSRAILGPSKSWSTMPASQRMRRFTA